MSVCSYCGSDAWHSSTVCSDCGLPRGSAPIPAIVSREKNLEQLRQDRDHFDEQHRQMLADKNAMQAERDKARAELAKYKEAMEREKSPKWSEDLKALANRLETGSHIGTYDDRCEAARQLRYMADCFTLKANFVPVELRIKELEGELYEIKDLLEIRENFADQQQKYAVESQQKLRESEAGAACMRERLNELLQVCDFIDNEDQHQTKAINKALSTDAGKSLLAELEQWRETKEVLEWSSENVLTVYHHGYGEWQIQGKGFNLYQPTIYAALLAAYQDRKGGRV